MPCSVPAQVTKAAVGAKMAAIGKPLREDPLAFFFRIKKPLSLLKCLKHH